MCEGEWERSAWRARIVGTSNIMEKLLEKLTSKAMKERMTAVDELQVRESQLQLYDCKHTPNLKTSHPSFQRWFKDQDRWGRHLGGGMGWGVMWKWGALSLSPPRSHHLHTFTPRECHPHAPFISCGYHGANKYAKLAAHA